MFWGFLLSASGAMLLFGDLIYFIGVTFCTVTVMSFCLFCLVALNSWIHLCFNIICLQAFCCPSFYSILSSIHTLTSQSSQLSNEGKYIYIKMIFFLCVTFHSQESHNLSVFVIFFFQENQRIFITSTEGSFVFHRVSVLNSRGRYNVIYVLKHHFIPDMFNLLQQVGTSEAWDELDSEALVGVD